MSTEEENNHQRGHEHWNSEKIMIGRALQNVARELQRIIALCTSEPAVGAPHDAAGAVSTEPGEGRVVEGVFDGEHMVGSDANQYAVPANYASKSKLVEGDLLKLIVTPSGNFIFKQIGPIERQRVVAELGYDSELDEYYAAHEEKRWRVLKASVTYFRGSPGDEIVALIPQATPSRWAAVENIMKRT